MSIILLWTDCLGLDWSEPSIQPKRGCKNNAALNHNLHQTWNSCPTATLQCFTSLSPVPCPAAPLGPYLHSPGRRCDAMRWSKLQETDGRSWSEWKDNNTVNALSHWMELLDWIDGWIVSSADGLPLKSSSVGLCDAFYRARVHLQWHGQQVHRQILFTTVLMYLTDLWATCTATATTPFPFTHSFSSHGSDRIGSTGGGRRKTGNNTTRKLVGHLRFTITGTLWRRELEEWTGWPIQVQQRLTSVYEGNLEDIVMRS